LTRSPKVISIKTGIHLAAASRSDKAYAFIRRKIVRGELKLGQAISRRQLARELRMSFLPVSEAFLRLEWEGLLESRPRAGTRVRIPTKKDVEEHYVVREALETQAARLFAEKATVEEKADLYKFAVWLDGSNQNGVSRLSYLNLHEKLHQKITEYAHCPALSDAVEEIYALASAWMCVDRSADASPGHQSSGGSVGKRRCRDCSEGDEPAHPRSQTGSTSSPQTVLRAKKETRNPLLARLQIAEAGGALRSGSHENDSSW